MPSVPATGCQSGFFQAVPYDASLSCVLVDFSVRAFSLSVRPWHRRVPICLKVRDFEVLFHASWQRDPMHGAPVR